MRRLLALSLPLVAAALLAVGCGDDSSSGASPPPPPPAPTEPQPPPPPAPKPKPWRTFTKAELPRIALRPRDAPADLRYVRAESGPRSLAEVLYLPRQQREVRSYGFVGIHDAVFAGKSATSDRRVAQRIWLFKTRKGASGWYEKTKQDAVDLRFETVDAPLLGEESFAAQGLIQIGGGRAINHTFRLGNAVFTVIMYGDVTPPSQAGALAAAKAALARAKSI